MNYFTLLSLTPEFQLDSQALESAYFSAQRQYHPDRFVGKPAQERQQALQRSLDINQAYNTLKNPLPRAQYLLHLQGIAVGTDHDSVKPSASLLMETMEWRETIDGADDLAKLGGSLNEAIAQSEKHIAGAYDDKSWDAMAQETLRLGYLLKSADAIRVKKSKA
jgi:molecular chaperone HscB